MPAGKPKPAARKRGKALTLAQLAARGKGARKVPILINRLPKDLIERIKREGRVIRSPIYTTRYSPLWGERESSSPRTAIVSFEHKPKLGVIAREVRNEVKSGFSPRDWPISSTAYFDAKTGQRLTSAQVMNRMKKRGIKSLG